MDATVGVVLIVHYRSHSLFQKNTEELIKITIALNWAVS
jgi:hypothetical protein